jgi:hypothetical protein
MFYLKCEKKEAAKNYREASGILALQAPILTKKNLLVQILCH